VSPLGIVERRQRERGGSSRSAKGRGKVRYLGREKKKALTRKVRGGLKFHERDGGENSFLKTLEAARGKCFPHRAEIRGSPRRGTLRKKGKSRRIFLRMSQSPSF